MCGVAGVLARSRAVQGAARVERMIAALGHRGPDGVRVETRAGAALAHARLSIIDLDGGWQPLHAAGSTVIGNGEIYNYRELAEDFGLAPKLATGSDFEPLLHLYALEGERAFARLRGMFAFCLLGADGRNWLVRDAFGIKPLYIKRAKDGLLFASEPQALWSDTPPAPRLSVNSCIELLTLNYVLNDGPDLDGVSRVPPGAVIQIGDGEAIAETSLPDPTQSPPAPALARRIKPPMSDATPSPSSDRAAVTALDAVLEESVRLHQRSDVPYGLFLSGGVDSTAIAVMMARLNARPVKAYTCGFDVGDAPDERAAAERVARALDLDWREVRFGEEDFWRTAPLVAAALDDPTCDYACLPTFKLAQIARRDLTVVLSGEGGDELFAGYGRYRRALRPRWLGGRPAEPQINAPFIDPAALAGARPLAAWREAGTLASGSSPLLGAQRADVRTWLSRDLLLKLDRCLMAHGLEGRTPFLDLGVARFAFSLSDRMKVRGSHGKWILRRWLSEACPTADAWGRKKGFTTPVSDWIDARAKALAPRVAACRGLVGVSDAAAVEAVFHDDRGRAQRWPLLFFALWWRIHAEGASPQEAAQALGIS